MPATTLSERVRIAALFAVAVAAARLWGPDGPLYWDSFGYVVDAARGRAGALMLGRPGFALVSHALVSAWRAGGGALTDAEPLLRWWWTLVSAAGAPTLCLVALRLGRSWRESLWAGLLLALSPAVAASLHAVLTDGPSMTLGLAAMAAALSAVARGNAATMFMAGALLGASGSVREQSLVHGLSLGLLVATAPRERRAALGLACIAGTTVVFAAPVLWFATTQRGYLEGVAAWGEHMRRERESHPWGPRELVAWLGWIAAVGPTALVGAAVGWRELVRARDPRTLALAVPSLAQLVALAGYQDISFSPRYLLAALPLALFVPAGVGLARGTDRTRRAGLLVAVAVCVAGAMVVRARQRPLRASLATLEARLGTVPHDAAVVTGQLCPAVVYHREIARLSGATAPRWVQVCPGWRWPAPLAVALDAHRAAGRTVVIDLRESSWVGPRQAGCRAEAARYAERHGDDVGVVVWR